MSTRGFLLAKCRKAGGSGGVGANAGASASGGGDGGGDGESRLEREPPVNFVAAPTAPAFLPLLCFGSRVTHARKLLAANFRLLCHVGGC